MINAIGNGILTSSLIGVADSGGGVITDGLKMWLPLGNTSSTSTSQTTPDISGNSNDATLYSGRVLSLNDNGSYPNSIEVPLWNMAGTKASFALWFKRTSVWGTSTSNHLLDFESADNNERFIIAFQTTESDKLNVYSKDGATAAWGDDAFGNVSLDTWYRLVVTVDGTTLKCYLNGTQFGNTATLDAGVNLTNAATNFLAAAQGGTGSLYNGFLSNVQIWNEVWTAQDVLYDYESPNNLASDNTSSALDAVSNLKLWLPLNEGDGTLCVENTSSPSESLYGHLNISSQELSTVWDVGVTRIPQLSMQDITIGENVLANTFNSVSGWTATYVSITAGTDAIARGYNCQVATKTALTQGSVLQQNYTTTAAGDLTVSVFVKMDSTTPSDAVTSLALRKDSARTVWAMIYDWSTGTASVRSGSPSLNNMTASDVGGGWYRLSFSVGGFSVSDTLIYELYPDIENSTGAIGDAVLFFGPQLEYGKVLSDVRLNSEAAKNSMTYTKFFKPTSGGVDTDAMDTTLRSRENSFNADGRGWAQVADNSSLDFGTGAYTMECWAKFKYIEQGDGVGYNVICTLGGNGIAAFSPSIGVYSNHVIGGSSIYFKAYAGSTGVDASSDTFTKGDWYHIVLTRDGSGNVKFYVDATLKDTDTNTNNATNADDPQIGRDSTDVRYFGDLISDVRYYNIALTQEQIQNNYDQGTAAHSN